MTCGPDELVVPAADVPGLVVGPVGDADLRDAARVQRAAFGQAPPRRESYGGGAVLARVGGAPAAVAAWTAVVDGTSEVAGVATAEAWRRRGLAGVVTAAVARAAFAAGARLCLLSPGNDEAQRVYARAGFRGTATMLHWADPD